VQPEFDVVIVGGGVNGTGVLRDLTLRGLKCALVEHNDLAFGASGNSSGMIHGGPRYMEKTPEVTYSSCLDSGYIQRIAPHMLFRVPFLLPVFDSGLAAAKELLLYDAFFTAYDRYQDLKRSKKHLRFDSDEVHELEPGLIPAYGAITFDEWGLDGVRLCVENAKDAVERGAALFLRKKFVELEVQAGQVRGAWVVDVDTGLREHLGARVVVNATGAWTNLTREILGVRLEELEVRPGKGVHVYLDRRLSNFAIVTNAVDGRQVFLLPWQNMSVLGTTDDDFYGDPNYVFATEDEVRYLYQAIERVFPSVRAARPIGTWAGLRPTLARWGVPPDALSRDHRLVDHASAGKNGLFSLIGGKLASYRLFAEEVSDVVAKHLGNANPCRTHLEPLPGGDKPVEPGSIMSLARVDRLTERRLVFRHGSRALNIAREVEAGALSAEVVCPCEPVTEAEVRYVVRNEWARNVDDVARRTRLGLGPCGGKLCAEKCGAIVAEERGLAAEEGHEMTRQFFHGQAQRTACFRGIS
jgi:glycerol-3-phosphate dehydrogenase